MIRAKDITVRVGQIDDIESLKDLTKDAWGPYVIEWAEAVPDWLVAVVENKVVGCVQLCLGRPVGRVEVLCVQEGFSPRETHEVRLALCQAGYYALKETGSQIAVAMVSFKDKGFKRMLKHRFEARVADSGNILASYIGATDA